MGSYQPSLPTLWWLNIFPILILRVWEIAPECIFFFCVSSLQWANAEVFARKPGHVSVTSMSDVEDGWKQNNLAQSQRSPLSRTSGCHPCRQMSQAEVTTPRAVRVIEVHCLSACIPLICTKTLQYATLCSRTRKFRSLMIWKASKKYLKLWMNFTLSSKRVE